MRFMIKLLGFIIFVFLISNIVINLENLSVEFDKHTNVEAEDKAEDNVYNTTSRNNTYINTKKYYYSAKEIFDLIALTVSLTAITICGCLCIWEITRCNIQHARRNCPLYFSSCCVDIHNNPDNPPPPDLVVHYQPADYQDVYQIA